MFAQAIDCGISNLVLVKKVSARGGAAFQQFTWNEMPLTSLSWPGWEFTSLPPPPFPAPPLAFQHASRETWGECSTRQWGRSPTSELWLSLYHLKTTTWWFPTTDSSSNGKWPKHLLTLEKKTEHLRLKKLITRNELLSPANHRSFSFLSLLLLCPPSYCCAAIDLPTLQISYSYVSWDNKLEFYDF